MSYAGLVSFSSISLLNKNVLEWKWKGQKIITDT
jgi:hypothetical protein